MANGCSQCLQCGNRLPLYLRLKEAEFCSPEHRDAYQREQQKLALERLIETEKILSQALASRLEKPLAGTDPASSGKAVEGGPDRDALSDSSETPPFADPLPGRRPDSAKPSEFARANPAPAGEPSLRPLAVAVQPRVRGSGPASQTGAPPTAPAFPISPPPRVPGSSNPSASGLPGPVGSGDTGRIALPPARPLAISTPHSGCVPEINLAWYRANKRPRNNSNAGPKILPLAFNGWSGLLKVVLAPYPYRSEPPKNSLRRLLRNGGAPPHSIEQCMEARAASLRAAVVPVDCRNPGWAAAPVEILLRPAIPVTADHLESWSPAFGEAVRVPCSSRDLPDRNPVLDPRFETAAAIAPEATPLQLPTPRPKDAEPKARRRHRSASLFRSAAALLGQHPEATSFAGGPRLNVPATPVSQLPDLLPGPALPLEPTLPAHAEGSRPAPTHIDGYRAVARLTTPSRFPAPLPAAPNRPVIPPPPASPRPLARPKPQAASAMAIRPNADFVPVRVQLRTPTVRCSIGVPELPFACRVALLEHHGPPPPTAVAAHGRSIPPQQEAFHPGILLISPRLQPKHAVSPGFGTLREISWRPADRLRVYSADLSVLEMEPDVSLPSRQPRQSAQSIPPLQPLDDTVFILRASRPGTGLRTCGVLPWATLSPVCDPALPIPEPVNHWARGAQPDVRDLLDLHVELEPQPPQPGNSSRVLGASFAPAAPELPREWNPGALGPPSSDLRSLALRRAGSSWMAAVMGRIPRVSNPVRVALIAVPVLIAGLFWAGRPSTPGASKSSEPGFFSNSISSIRSGIRSRAGIRLVDDFRSGMDRWVGDGDGADSWKVDQTGFVQPNRLAIYRPSLGMSNYTMEFLGEVDRKALSWVFRAQDTRNYYVAKLIIARPGPLPSFALGRWAVVDGKETPYKETVLPLTFRGDALFDVKLEANGSDFTLHIGGSQAAFWTDTRLATGGVGFFSGKGENSRIRWLRFEHQYDVLGRICAYLSPSVVGSLNDRSNGSWK